MQRTVNILKLEKPSSWFKRTKVYSPDGLHFGIIRQKNSIIHTYYLVSDTAGKEYFRLIGSSLNTRVIKIHKDRKVIGDIKKKWTGDIYAGNMTVLFPIELDAIHKILLLGSILAIAVTHPIF